MISSTFIFQFVLMFNIQESFQPLVKISSLNLQFASSTNFINDIGMFKTQKKKKEPNKHPNQELSYSSVEHIAQKASETDQVSFLNEQWPINNDQLNKCLLQEYSETFDSKAEPPLPQALTMISSETNYRTLFNKLKSNSAIIRESGLDDLYKCLRNSQINPECLPLVDFPRLFKEDHPKCFQKVITCYEELVKHTEPSLDLMQLAIEQGFQKSKPTSVTKLLLYLFTNHYTKLQDCILKGLSNSSTKVVQSFLMSLKFLVSTFGVRSLNYLKTYMLVLKKIITGGDPLTKNSTLNLVKECMSSEGPDCMISQLQDLPEGILLELSNGQVCQTSKLNCNDKSTHSRSPVTDNPLRKYTDEWVSNVINAGKWNEKVKYLQELLGSIRQCKVISGQFRHIANLVQKLLPSNNMNISIVLLRLAGALAKQIGKNFTNDAKEMLPLILLKYRDKKHQIVTEVDSCVEQLCEVLPAEEIIPIVQAALKDKNSNMKIQVLHFIQKLIERQLAQGLDARLEQALNKLFSETFSELLKDNSSQVRDQSEGCLRSIAQFLPVNKFPILKQQFKINLNEQRRKSSQKQRNSRQRRDSSSVDLGAILNKALSKLSDVNSSLERRKEGIAELSNIILQNTPLALSKVSHISDICNTLKNRLMESPKLLLKPLIVCIGILYEKAGVHLKASSKQMVVMLLDALKSDSVRTQLLETLAKVESTVGLDSIMPAVISSLESDRPERAGVLEFLNEQAKKLKSSQIIQLYKGILNCLCDKNKQIRHFCVKLIQSLGVRFQISKLRQLAQRFKPNFMKQLESILSQFDPNPKNSATKRVVTLTNRISQNDNSLIAPDSNFQPHPIVHSLPILDLPTSKFTFMQEDEWLCHKITFQQQKKLTEKLSRLFEEPIFEKMISIQYNSVAQAGNKIKGMYENQSKQQFLIDQATSIMKWVLLRLWGGNTSASSLIGLVQNHLTLIYKNKIQLKDQDSVIIMAILREYILSNDFEEPPEIFKNIIQLLIFLTSGLKITGQFLMQYQKDITKLHHYFGYIKTRKYKNQLFLLMKALLINFMGEQLILAQISEIPAFSKDNDIVQYLYERYGQAYLSGYGLERSIRKSIVQTKKQEAKDSQNRNENKDDQMIQQPIRQCQKITERIGEQQSQLIAQLADKQVPIVQSKIMGVESSLTQKQPQSYFPQSKSLDGECYKIIKLPLESKRKNTQNLAKNFNMSEPRAGTSFRSHQRQITQSLQISLNSFQYSTLTTIGEYLDRVSDGDMHAIQYFEKIMAKPTLRNSVELASNADSILANFLKLCLCVLEARDQMPISLLIRCYNLILQAIKCKYIHQNTKKVLPSLTQFALHQAIYEDEQRTVIWSNILEKYGSENYKDDIFVVLVNKIMLRILQNYPSFLLLSILLDLTVKYMKNQGSLKLFTVIRRCIRRVSQRFTKQFTIVSFAQFMEIANKYCQQMSDYITPEDEVLGYLKNILKSIQQKHTQIVAVWQQKIPQSSKGQFLEFCEASTLSKYQLPRLDIRSPRPTQSISNRSGIQLSTEARKRLECFKQVYPEFQIQKYLEKGEAVQGITIQSAAKTSQTQGRVLNKDVFDEIRQEVCECFDASIEKDIQTVDVAGKTTKMKEGLKAIRTRIDQLKAKFQILSSQEG